MKKTIISLLLVAVMAMSLLCACGNKSDVLTQAEAEKIAMEHFGLKKKDVDEIYTHIATGEIVGYSIHITAGDTDYSILVDAATGELHESDH